MEKILENYYEFEEKLLEYLKRKEGDNRWPLLTLGERTKDYVILCVSCELNHYDKRKDYKYPYYSARFVLWKKGEGIYKTKKIPFGFEANRVNCEKALLLSGSRVEYEILVYKDPRVHWFFPPPTEKFNFEILRGVLIFRRFSGFPS